MFPRPGIGPLAPIPPILVLQRHNDIAEPGGTAILDGRSWVLVGRSGLILEGAKVRANGPLAVEAKVFSTLGTLVNKARFKVTRAEYEKLPLQGGDSSRVLMMPWNGRTRDGKPAGTGAFVMRSVVSLAKGGQRIIDSRIVGVLRRQ